MHGIHFIDGTRRGTTGYDISKNKHGTVYGLDVTYRYPLSNANESFDYTTKKKKVTKNK
jgi:hypothetical protein